MTKAALYKKLYYVDHSRERRAQITQHILQKPDLIAPLMQIAFEIDDPVSSKACWVLEFTAKKRLDYVFPHLDFFIENLDKVKLESSLRPVAKICEELCLSYFKDQNMETMNALSDPQLEKMVTACFDWLIGDHKVAPKVFSMTSLFLLGKKFDWIHEELRLVIEQNFNQGSAAYKSRARHVLHKLKK